MGQNAPLFVLIVREAGLRSTLVARLSMAGADVLTADDFNDRLVTQSKRPAVLITDAAAVEEHDGGSAALLAEPNWLCLVIVAPETGAPSDNPRLILVERADAAQQIALLVCRWRARPD